MKRMCLKCLKNKDVSKFDIYESTEDGYFDNCKSCEKKINRNKVNSISWHRKLKQKCVNYKGGKCSVCGYSKCLAALDFHHIFPKKNKGKRVRIIGMKSWGEEIKRELDNCILVCTNCHREIHYYKQLKAVDKTR